MDYNLIISNPAEVETIKAYLWYEKQKNNLGEEFFEELDLLYAYIKLNPFLFPTKRKKTYREAVLKRFPFVVVYIIDKNKIVVLSVFKTTQNPEKKP